jgi:hypothetical protein
MADVIGPSVPASPVVESLSDDGVGAGSLARAVQEATPIDKYPSEAQ